MLTVHTFFVSALREVFQGTEETFGISERKPLKCFPKSDILKIAWLSIERISLYIPWLRLFADFLSHFVYPSLYIRMIPDILTGKFGDWPIRQ